MIHGRNLIIKIDGVAIAAARSCEVSVQNDVQEVSSPDSGKHRTYIPGRTEWSVSTNHLVLTPLSDLQMVGKEVELTLFIRNAEALPFDEFVEGVTALQNSTVEYNAIVYDTVNKRFLARVDRTMQMPLYYRSWPNGSSYITPELGTVYEHDGDYYQWDGSDLVEVETTDVQVSGNAVCKQFRLVGAVGNLAQGSFSWQGSGPLE